MTSRHQGDEQRVPPPGFDHDAWLARNFRHGLLRDRGRATGLWFVSDVMLAEGEGATDASAVTLVVMGRGRGGRPAAVQPRVDAVADLGTVALGHLLEVLGWQGRALEGRTAAFGGQVRSLAQWVAGERTIRRHPAAFGRAVALGLLGVGDGYEGREAMAAASLAPFGEAAAEFLESLDRRAVRHVLRHDLTDAVPEAWSGLDPALTPDAPLAVALDARPDLADLLARAWASDPAALRVAVAAGRVDDLARDAAPARGVRPDLPRGTLRRAGEAWRRLTVHDLKVTWQWLPYGMAEAGQDGVVRFLKMTSGIPLDWFPTAPGEWDALLALAPALNAADDACAVKDVRHLLPAGGRWAWFLGRLRSAAGVVPLDAAVQGLGDVARAFAGQVLGPAVALASEPADGHLPVPDDALEQVAFALLFSGRSLPRMLEDGRRWHARQHRIAAGLDALTGGAGRSGWVASLPDLVRGDLTLRVLTDAASLTAEGHDGPDGVGVRGLAHCVGGYAARCRRGESRIASVSRRHPDGRVERLSTVEFVFGDGTPGTTQVSQHRGPRNAAPPPGCVALVDGYLAGVLDGSLPSAPDGLAVPSDVAEGMDEAGYDWRVPGAWEAVVALWGPCLPRPLRGVGAASLGRLASSVPTDEDRNRVWCPRPFGSRGP